MSDTARTMDPPATNRGVPISSGTPEITSQLDWLRVTVPHTSAIQSYLDTFPGECIVESEGARAWGVYTDVLLFSAGRVDWNQERPELKVCFTWTGSDLDKFQTHHKKLLAWAVSQPGAKVTRLDFAFDHRGKHCAPDDVLACYERGYAKTHARTHSRVSSARNGAREGVTVYIGGRQSTRLLRVYDKAAQQEESGNRTRVELEVKAPLAGKLAEAMVEYGINAAGMAAIKGFIVTGVRWIDDVTSGNDAAIYERAGRKETDWEKWVLDVALPNVLKAMKEDVGNIRALVRGYMATLD